MAKEAPIFIHTHDMLAWLTDHLESWPRAQRFFLAQEAMSTAPLGEVQACCPGRAIADGRPKPWMPRRAQ